MRALAIIFLALGMYAMPSRPVVNFGMGMARPAAMERGRLPGMISEDEQGRLANLLHAGKITFEQYAQATRIHAPPPGVDPAEWEWRLKPGMGPPTQEQIAADREGRGYQYSGPLGRRDKPYPPQR